MSNTTWFQNTDIKNRCNGILVANQFLIWATKISSRLGSLQLVSISLVYLTDLYEDAKDLRTWCLDKCTLSKRHELESGN